MNRMIIDVEYLKKLSRELEVNKSDRLLHVRRSIEDGLRLDSKIRSKLSRQNMLLENINDIIYTNRMLHESVEKAIMGFSPLESLKSDVQIEDFILLTNTAPDAQASLLNMFGDQIESLEGITSLIEQIEANINAMTSPDTWYEFQDGDVLWSYLLDSSLATNTTGQMEYDSYTNSIKISGFLLPNLIDYMKSEQQKLNSYVKDFYEHKENNTSMYISDFNILYPEYMNSVKTNDHIYVDFSTIIEDTNILEVLSKLNNELEKLSLYTENLERLKSNKTILQSMVYNVKIAQMLKPFEDVIGNSDFAELSAYDKEGYTITNPNDIDMYIKLFGKYDDAIIDDEIDEKGNYTALVINIEALKEKYRNEVQTLLSEEANSSGFKEYSAEDGTRLDFFTNLVNKATINSNDEYLTDSQKEIYWYHYNKFGEAKALDYIKALEDSINAKKGLKMTYEYLDYLAQDDGLGFGDNISLFFKGTIDGVSNTFEGLGNIFNPDEIRSETDYAKLYLLQILDSSTYTEENLKNLIENTSASVSEINQFEKLVDLSTRLGEGFWRSLSTHTYQVGSAIGYMALPVMLNLVLPGVVGSVLLFASTLGNSVEQSYQTLGSLSWKSYAYGALTALSEVLMEHLGGLPGFSSSKKFWASILSEGMQEFFQTFITGAIDATHFKTEYDLTSTTKEAFLSAIYGIFTAGIMQGTMRGITLVYKSIEGVTIREELSYQEALLKLEQRYIFENFTEDMKQKAKSMEKILLENKITNESILTIQNIVNDTSVEGLTQLFKYNSEIRILVMNNLTIDQQQKLIKEVLMKNPDLFTNNKLELTGIDQSNSLTNETYLQYVQEAGAIIEFFLGPKAVEIYSNAMETGKLAALLGYEEHAFVHVVRVAQMSLIQLDVMNASFEFQPVDGYTANMDPITILISGLAHDLGMCWGDFFVDKKNSLEISILDKLNGNKLRDTHSANSAIYILHNRLEFGSNPELIAMITFLHSKSFMPKGSFITSKSDLTVIAEFLYKNSAKLGYKINISNLVEVDSNGIPIVNADGSYNFKPGIAEQIATGTAALRVGDGLADKTGHSHAQSEFEVVNVVGSEFAVAALLENSDIDIEEIAAIESINSEIYVITKDGERISLNLDPSHPDYDSYNYSKRFISGQRNVRFEIVSNNGTIEYHAHVLTSNAPASTWDLGISETFGEFNSIPGLRQEVVLHLPDSLTAAELRFYKELVDKQKTAKNQKFTIRLFDNN